MSIKECGDCNNWSCSVHVSCKGKCTKVNDYVFAIHTCPDWEKRTVKAFPDAVYPKDGSLTVYKAGD